MAYEAQMTDMPAMRQSPDAEDDGVEQVLRHVDVSLALKAG